MISSQRLVGRKPMGDVPNMIAWLFCLVDFQDHRNYVTWDLGHVFFETDYGLICQKNVWILALYLNILAQFLVHMRDMVYCHCLSLRNVSIQQDPRYSGVTWRLCLRAQEKVYQYGLVHRCKENTTKIDIYIISKMSGHCNYCKWHCFSQINWFIGR